MAKVLRPLSPCGGLEWNSWLMAWLGLATAVVTIGAINSWKFPVCLSPYPTLLPLSASLTFITLSSK